MAGQDSDSTKDLGSLLQNVFLQKNWQERMGMHQVFLFWNEIFGELANRAQPDIIRGDTLWVNVTDSVWMQQLQFEKQALLDQINTKLRQLKKRSGKDTGDVPKIKDIKFKLAPSLNVTSRAIPGQPANQGTTPVDASRLKKFEASINSISDESIKKSLINLWIAQECRPNTQKIV